KSALWSVNPASATVMAVTPSLIFIPASSRGGVHCGLRRVRADGRAALLWNGRLLAVDRWQVGQDPPADEGDRRVGRYVGQHDRVSGGRGPAGFHTHTGVRPLSPRTPAPPEREPRRRAPAGPGRRWAS